MVVFTEASLRSLTQPSGRDASFFGLSDTERVPPDALRYRTWPSGQGAPVDEFETVTGSACGIESSARDKPPLCAPSHVVP